MSLAGQPSVFHALQQEVPGTHDYQESEIVELGS